LPPRHSLEFSIMRNHLVFVIVINLLVGVILGWAGLSRMNELRQLHSNIAKESVDLVASNIAQFMRNKKRLTGIFVENETTAIRQLANSPESDELYEQLRQKVAHYFPNVFAFTIADPAGNPIVEDFDGYVGETCLKDLSFFAKQHEYRPRIHPSADAYHFDVMSQYGDGEGIFFISFRADILGNTLQAIEAYNHQLLLIMEAGMDLIEVTAEGARNHWIRDDYRLNDKEKMRILANQPVPDTTWSAIDLHLPTLFSATQKQILSQSIATMAILLIISILFLSIMARTHRRRAEAENIRDQFLSTISNELRIPLSTVCNSLNLVLGGIGGQLSEQTRKLTQTALQNTNRIILLVDDLLDLRRLENGNIKIESHPLNLPDIVRNCIHINQEYAKSFGVEYRLHCNACTEIPESSNTSCDNRQVMVMGNKRRLEQAINNLLSNAARHGASNSIVEVVICQRGKMVRLEVRDKGPGVPASFISHTFEKFGQLAREKSPHNTGHGLAIINHIIKLHHGRAGYKTISGYGAVFFIELPLLKPETPANGITDLQ